MNNKHFYYLSIIIDDIIFLMSNFFTEIWAIFAIDQRFANIHVLKLSYQNS